MKLLEKITGCKNGDMNRAEKVMVKATILCTVRMPIHHLTMIWQVGLLILFWRGKSFLNLSASMMFELTVSLARHIAQQV